MIHGLVGFGLVGFASLVGKKYYVVEKTQIGRNPPTVKILGGPFTKAKAEAETDRYEEEDLRLFFRDPSQGGGPGVRGVRRYYLTTNPKSWTAGG